MRVSRLIAIVLFVASAPASATEPTAEHRAAVTRYLTASRSHVVTRHFALPISIRQAAIEGWGFDHMTLGVEAILAMEAHVDEAALESTVLALHARQLPVDVVSAAADFYESDVGRRLLRALVGSLLPSTDPLFQPTPSPPTPDDQRAFEAFKSASTSSQRAGVSGSIRSAATAVT